MPPRKIIQLLQSSRGRTLALCDDGSVWKLLQFSSTENIPEEVKWIYFIDSPQDPPKETA